MHKKGCHMTVRVLTTLFLLLFLAAAAGIVAAEEETTYYCYDYSTQSWRVCTPEEAIHAKEALEKEIPKELSRDEWEAVINSNQPYWQYYLDPPTGTPTPTPTPTPTATPTPSPRATLSPSLEQSFFTPWFSNAPSAIPTSGPTKYPGRSPIFPKYTITNTPTPTPTSPISPENTISKDFGNSFFSPLFPVRNFSLFKWF